MNGPRPPGNAERDVAEENREKLLAEFRSVLDESLILTIADERDLVKDYEEIRGILNLLAETARAEAATGFDPSGLGSLGDLGGLRLDEAGTSGSGLDGLESSAEYATTISEHSDRSENQRFTEQTHLSDERKIQELQLVFQGRWKEHTLKFMLKQNGGNLERTFDELLDRQHFEDAGDLPKGIDGFFVPDEDWKPSKGKAGRAGKGNGKSKKQVVEVKYKAVSSTVNDGELEGAKDFAGPATPRGAGAKGRPLPSFTSPLLALSTTSTTAVPCPTTSDFGAEHMRTAAKLRRGGPLARQGAVVYTERAREERTAFTAYASREAEALVNRQSTSTHIDLHGVVVMDGVRIAKQRVWAWWNGLGEEDRKSRAKREGFTVVTGIGRHSAGGVSRLRQAVGACLENDGWRFETLTGKFYVTGRRA